MSAENPLRMAVPVRHHLLLNLGQMFGGEGGVVRRKAVRTILTGFK